MRDARIETRKKRAGLLIAALHKVTFRGGVWVVPSERGRRRYIVRLDPVHPRCTCADHELTRAPCKHIHAVRYVEMRERSGEKPATVRANLTVADTIHKRKTYPQNWSAYNKAQVNEKRDFQRLLFDLCKPIVDPVQKTGRPRYPLSEAIFAIVFKVYSTASARRFMCDLQRATELRYISKTPHFNTVLNAFGNAAITPILHDLITQTSLPFTAFETEFACDSSGFQQTLLTSWAAMNYRDRKENERNWDKLHLICGVNTHIVTGVEIRERDTSDTIMLPTLLEKTVRNFRVTEVSADKAYASQKNLSAILDVGATPYIPFKDNATGAAGGRDGVWLKAFMYFKLHREEFLAHYHKRSNVETTFSMIKRKFSGTTRCRSEVARHNELLAKVVAHNICRLIDAIYERGIDLNFTTRPMDNPYSFEYRDALYRQVAETSVDSPGFQLQPPHSADQESGGMQMANLVWRTCGGGEWCSLLRLDLSSITDKSGVYVIWHGGDNPRVVRVGQGDIADRLGRHRADNAILKYQSLGLFVTWASVPAAQLDGVERYLADSWNPLVGDAFPDCVPIAVNQPW